MKNTSASQLAVLISLMAVLLCAGAAWSHVLPGLPPIPGMPHHVSAPTPGVNAPLVPMAEAPAVVPAAAKPNTLTLASLPASVLPTYTATFLSGVPGYNSPVSAYLTGVDSEGDAVGYSAQPETTQNGQPYNLCQVFVYDPSVDFVFSPTTSFSRVPTGVGFETRSNGQPSVLTVVGYQESVYPSIGLPQSFELEIVPDLSSGGELTGYITGSVSLGRLPGGTFSAAMGVDDTGTYVVGYSDMALGQIHGFIDSGTSFSNPFLPTPGAMADLGTLPGGSNSVAYAAQTGTEAFLGDASVSALFLAGAGDFGQLDTSGFPILNSFVSFAETPLDVSQITGNPLSNPFTAQLTGPANDAYAVDADGDVAGEMATGATDSSGNPIYNAYVGKLEFEFNGYAEGLVLNTTSLGALATGANSYAYGVNPSGLVVGESEVSPGGAIHGFLADPAGVMHDLNTLIPAVQRTLPGATKAVTIDYVGGINASGEIVGAAQGNPVILTQTAPGEFDVTSNVTITATPPIWNKADKTWLQNVTVSNLPVAGMQSFDLVLDKLSPSTVSLTDGSGMLLSRPYVASGTVTNGTTTFTLVFSGPKTAHISYTPHVYQLD